MKSNINKNRWPFALVAALLATHNVHAQSTSPAEPAPPAPDATAPDAPESAQAPDEPTADPEPTAPEPAEASAAAPAGPDTTDSEVASESSEPAASTEVIEVTVVGTPVARTPGSAHVVRSRQMERFEYDDPHAVLASVPGVYTRGEDGVGLRPNIGIRGVDPDRSAKLTLMEDGVLFGPAPYSAPAAYYFPLITRMTQLRVIKGPGATSFGPQTIGGALDLITRPIPASLAGAADLTLGSFLHRKAHVHLGTSDGRVGFLIEGIHLANDGFKELPQGGNTGFYRNEWMAKGAYSFNPAGALIHELRLKLSYADELSNETYLGLSDADFRQNPYQRYQASALDQMRSHRTSLVLSHVYEPTEQLSFTTHVYRHDYTRGWRKVNRFGGSDLFPALTGTTQSDLNYQSLLSGEQDSMGSAQQLWIGPNDREFVSQGVETRMRLDANTGALAHRVEAGLRLHHDQVSRHHTESPYQLVAGDVFPVGAGELTTVRTSTVNSGEAHAIAVHVNDAVTYDALTVTPGVRAEVMRLAFSDLLSGAEHARWLGVVIPGVGAYYALTEDLGVLGGVYRGFSAPVPGLADATTGKDAAPEMSVNYEAGVRYSRGSSRAELIGFYNDYSNMNGTCTFSAGCPDATIDTTINAGRAAVYGIEVLAEHELKVGALRLPLSVAYTLQQTEFQGAFESRNPAWAMVQAGDRIPYIPNQQLSVNVGVEERRAGANIAVTYVSSMREQAGQAPIASVLHTDAQFLVDLSARYQVFDRVQLYVNVRNLLDSVYVVSRRPFGARPNAPRWLQIGAKIEL